MPASAIDKVAQVVALRKLVEVECTETIRLQW